MSPSTWDVLPPLVPNHDTLREGIRIGFVRDHEGQERDIRLDDRLVSRSSLIPGQPGQGKSSLLANIAGQAMARGYGLQLIDPAGDLALDFLKIVPESRHEDVIWLNLQDKAYPIRFNFFGIPRDPSDLVLEFISMLEQLSPDSVTGESTKRLLRKLLLLGFIVRTIQPWTFRHALRFLEDSRYRADILRRLANHTYDDVIVFWQRFEAQRYLLESKAILNRL